ncbi:hypothetical protein EDB92DRAFT_1559822 [Lactarius akahatsu]|uniref:Uncharacterized protein n=1 Tax=Lactarius akahatsu TaxID=416441 RepID=A0AAD4LCX2_9AGAM|nr:hypothetical protein EDB92DRAFT_1559822 [Lactarius akahatsu]
MRAPADPRRRVSSHAPIREENGLPSRSSPVNRHWSIRALKKDIPGNLVPLAARGWSRWGATRGHGTSFFFFPELSLSRDAYHAWVQTGHGHGTYKPVARWERGQGRHRAIGVVARAQNRGRLPSRGVETVAPYLGCENIRIRGAKVEHDVLVGGVPPLSDFMCASKLTWAISAPRDATLRKARRFFFLLTNLALSDRWDKFFCMWIYSVNCLFIAADRKRGRLSSPLDVLISTATGLIDVTVTLLILRNLQQLRAWPCEHYEQTSSSPGTPCR